MLLWSKWESQLTEEPVVVLVSTRQATFDYFPLSLLVLILQQNSSSCQRRDVTVKFGKQRRRSSCFIQTLQDDYQRWHLHWR